MITVVIIVLDRNRNATGAMYLDYKHISHQ